VSGANGVLTAAASGAANGVLTAAASVGGVLTAVSGGRIGRRSTSVSFARFSGIASGRGGIAANGAEHRSQNGASLGVCAPQAGQAIKADIGW